MSGSHILYFIAIIIIAIIFGIARVLGVNLHETYGKSWGEKNKENWGMDEKEKKFDK